MTDRPTTGTPPATLLTALESGHWTLDPARSSVGLRARSIWGLATVTGSFDTVGGEGEIGPDHTATGSLTVDAGSVRTGQARLDTHLRSADFFDVERYPVFGFTADSAVPGPDGTVEITGSLTVLARTRPLAFTAQAVAAGPTEVTLSAELTINREEFGMSWNRAGMIKGPPVVILNVCFVHG
ncbi:YceI family protein [Streptacidiphilus sp. PAMC 29251]